MICIIISSFFSPLHRAEKILDKEIGSNIQITEAWYSKDENGCVISYSLGGISGIAGIFLNEDKVILQDTIDTMNNYSNNPYLSDTDKQNIAQTYFDSGAGSVVFWQYQIVRGDGDWKKIK